MKIVRRIALYRFHDENRRLLFERPKYRTDGQPPRNKIVTYRYGVGRGWATGGDHDPVMFNAKHPMADRYLYRLPTLLEAVAKGNDVWWTEGESDADALWHECEVVATSHHGGAGHVSSTQAEWFRGFMGRVFLAYDLDEDTPRGGNVGAHDVMLRYDLLRGVGIDSSQICVVGAAAGKDIRDHLNAGLDLSEVESVLDLGELRRKAALVRSDGAAWLRLGYSPEVAETVQAIENNPAWEYRGDRAGGAK